METFLDHITSGLPANYTKEKKKKIIIKQTPSPPISSGLF